MPRIASIDALRVAAIVAVLMLHARLFRPPGDLTPAGQVAEAALDHAARFGVPFFFFASGYLFGRGRGADPLGRAVAQVKRLAWLYVVWSILLLAWEVGGRAARETIAYGSADWPTLPGGTAFGLVRRFVVGVRMHLWFLPALGLATLVVGAVARFGPRVLVVVAAALYACGLACGSYADITGLDLGLLSRNGPFFGTLFVATGYVAAIRDWKPPLALGVGLTAAGYAIHLAELLALHRFAGVALVDPRVNYLAGTALVGIGVGLIALARPALGAGTIWPQWGTLTLGVYILHVDIEQLLAEINPLNGVGGEVLLVAATYPAALVLAAGIGRLPGGRRLVR